MIHHPLSLHKLLEHDCKRTQVSPAGSPSSENISDTSSKDQERLLPIANVGRIMKKSLPANAKISKEAKETVQECVSEFISFITGEAADKCQREKRKTINGEDLLWAMTTLGFQNYVGSLKSYLNKYARTSTESLSDNDVCETSNSTPKRVVSSQGFDDMYRERVVGYGDELVNMVKLHDGKSCSRI
ncbi:histone-fold protein [Artemisia annua]|uniref:Histone-fold protein n=1 Tax=Artemisia annua TaxID=35608 RepID=A0A2U1M141_ARTAN|nr:histone-fold protein [Artemisia annua]